MNTKYEKDIGGAVMAFEPDGICISTMHDGQRKAAKRVEALPVIIVDGERRNEVVSAYVGLRHIKQAHPDGPWSYQFIPSARGDCHSSHITFLLDLCRVGQAKGWSLVNGLHHSPSGVIVHTWLELNGWALDLANGRYVVTDANDYNRWQGTSRTRRMCSEEFWWLFRNRKGNRIERFVSRLYKYQVLNEDAEGDGRSASCTGLCSMYDAVSLWFFRLEYRRCFSKDPFGVQAAASASRALEFLIPQGRNVQVLHSLAPSTLRLFIRRWKDNHNQIDMHRLTDATLLAA